jgi:glycosyltransferase involved in cell wall biosynthesis
MSEIKNAAEMQAQQDENRRAGAEPSPRNGKAIWIVVPAFQEQQVIDETIRDLRSHYHNIVVVDDGSDDDTGHRAFDAGAIVLRHPINLGQGAALQTGIEYALQQGADLIVTFDADGQHQVADVARMIEALQEHKADIALGSRFLGRTVGMPAARRAILKMAIRFNWLATGLKLSDAHNGLRVLTRHTAELIKIHQDRMAHASEIVQQVAKHGLRHVEVPVTVVYTEYSLQKGQRLSNLFRVLGEIFGGRMQR